MKYLTVPHNILKTLFKYFKISNFLNLIKSYQITVSIHPARLLLCGFQTNPKPLIFSERSKIMSDDQDQFITFFDFKVDGSGITQLHVNQVTPRKLYSVTSVWSLLRPIKNDEPPVKNIPDVVNTFPEFAEVSDCAYHMLDGHIWIGHDIIRSDYPRLKKAFAEIDKDPPVPKDIIDIRHFLMSGTKLAGLADILGLGHPEQEKYPTLVNVRAIKLCEEAMSIYEPDMLKNYVDGHFHPVVSLLRDFADGEGKVAATNAAD